MTSLDSFSCKCTDDFEGDTCEKREYRFDSTSVMLNLCFCSGVYLFCEERKTFYSDSSTGLPCPPGKKTDDPQGRCCVFPFEYGGKTYQSCTKVAHHRLWCSFDKVYNGQWANCGKK